MKFKAIGQSILKDPTTVSKEVKRNRQVRESTCDKLPCPLLDKAPFVCNGCPKRRQNCGYKKIFYLAKQAQKQYEQTLVEAREGTPLNSKTFWEIDKVISDGVKLVKPVELTLTRISTGFWNFYQTNFHLD